MASSELIAFSGSLGTKVFSVLLDPVFTLEEALMGAQKSLKKPLKNSEIEIIEIMGFDFLGNYHRN